MQFSERIFHMYVVAMQLNFPPNYVEFLSAAAEAGFFYLEQQNFPLDWLDGFG